MAAFSQDRRARAESRSTSAVVPGLIAVVLIAVAVVIAVKSKKVEHVAAPVTTERNPFADLPQAAPALPKAGEPHADPLSTADSVATDPRWISAKAVAAEARVLYEAAIDARAKGDVALATQKCIAARDKYEAALTMSADREAAARTQHGELDEKAAAIRDERAEWSEKLSWLKRSVEP
ncbi:MAG TPA: hypothetical protein VM509_16060 [Planctomycetota bacterium]|nr:hypothetical protein [Planctomycetota bacterium]